MAQRISKRLADIVEALPIKKGMRILEIGCGPGVAARQIASRLRLDKGYVLAIDRSEKAIRQAIEGSQQEIASGRLAFRQGAIENFELINQEKPFDLAFAIRVGALDGRHPDLEKKALINITKALTKNGKLFIDGGNPLKEIPLEPYRK
ncbi:MAG: class I SAM-dependent methyltransferase [Cytophagia bacterium]|nr:class I SAM-dependent methyltransferase [Cytophagia bacterium]NBW35346.1 class I SAM-dependent methyltransferase [Cytophagia bacterium]